MISTIRTIKLIGVWKKPKWRSWGWAAFQIASQSDHWPGIHSPVISSAAFCRLLWPNGCTPPTSEHVNMALLNHSVCVCVGGGGNGGRHVVLKQADWVYAYPLPKNLGLSRTQILLRCWCQILCKEQFFSPTLSTQHCKLFRQFWMRINVGRPVNKAIVGQFWQM